MSQYDWTNEPDPGLDAWISGARKWLWRYKFRLGSVGLTLVLGLTEAYFPNEPFTGPVMTALKNLLTLLPLVGLIA